MRQTGRQAQRYLGVWLRALRDAVKEAGFRGRGSVRDPRRHSEEQSRLGCLAARTLRPRSGGWCDGASRKTRIVVITTSLTHGSTSTRVDVSRRTGSCRREIDGVRRLERAVGALVAATLAGVLAYVLLKAPPPQHVVQFQVMPPEHVFWLDAWGWEGLLRRPLGLFRRMELGWCLPPRIDPARHSSGCVRSIRWPPARCPEPTVHSCRSGRPTAASSGSLPQTN